MFCGTWTCLVTVVPNNRVEHGRMHLEVIDVVARGAGVKRRWGLCLICSVLMRGRESDIVLVAASDYFKKISRMMTDR